MIRVGNIQMGSISLGRIGAKISGGGASSPLYKQVLAKMPKTLRQSLVCWYSPNLQGLTNKELFDSDNLYEGGLKDLSGNGYDMDLHGFGGIEGSGHVDGDGNLCFDGVDDYAEIVSNKLLDNFTIIAKYKRLSIGNVYSFCKTESISTSQRIFALGRGSYPTLFNSTITQTMVGNDTAEFLSVGESSYTNKNTKTSFTRKISDKIGNVIRIAKWQENTIRQAMILKSFIILDKETTEEERTWIYDNMLVSQEVKKHKVTLWSGNDENARVLATLNVQSGNSLGSYNDDGDWIAPEYDIDSTHCSDSWYYYGTDELYYADAIEADVDLYCDTQLISESMLSKLENVTLEDGTTAREHLVCWYSPKLQGLTKKSVLEDGILEDLSENGNDMTLYGFTEDEDVIDSDGALCFDGVDDGGTSVQEYYGGANGFTFFVDSTDNDGTSHVVFQHGWNGIISYCQRANKNLLWVYGASLNRTRNTIDVIRATDTTTTPRDKTNYFYVGCQNGNTYFSNVDIRMIVLFNSTLTDEEITKVKTIMKLN